MNVCLMHSKDRTCESFFFPPVAKKRFGGKKKVGRQGRDPEGFPLKSGLAAGRRPKSQRISFQMKGILKDLSLAWPAGWPRQN